MLASSLTVIVLTGSLSVYLYSVSGWLLGQGQIDRDSKAEGAMRLVTAELREAMWTSVAANGRRIDYRKPLLGSNGQYAMPVTWDGVSRSIELSSGRLLFRAGSSERAICDDVITTDPLSSPAQDYRLFTPSAGAQPRSVTVMIATRSTGYRGKVAVGRARELVYMRNIPELVR